MSKIKFDITNLASLESDFAKAKEESYANDNGWTWLNCDIHLYNTCKNRLLKKQELKDAEASKNKRTKK